MVNLGMSFFLAKWLKKNWLNRTFWQQQRHSITGDADVKFYFVVFIVCALLAFSIACTGTLPYCMAVVVAISIGGNYCDRRPSITPRYFPATFTFAWKPFAFFAVKIKSAPP